jgi:hypothetical protein
MTPAEIIEIAKRTDLCYDYNGKPWIDAGYAEGYELFNFVKEIIARTQEQCAVMCEELGAQGYGTLYIAASIRKGGQDE